MRRFFEAWGKGDYELAERAYKSRLCLFLPSNTQTPVSRDDLVSTNEALREAFPDVSWRMEGLVADGDTVAFRFIQTGTHEGVFQGIAATGNKVEGSGILVSRLRDGKVIEQRKQFDSLGLMMQLGMTPTPKE